MYEIFEKLCKERGVTAYKVAKATEISTATLSNWKSGRSTPKIDKLQRIADYFDVPLETFTASMPQSKKRVVKKTYTMPTSATDELVKKFKAVIDEYSSVHTDGQSDWYIDPETAKIAQEVFSDPDKRVLFDAARTARPEAIRFAAQLLEQWKETNPNG